MAGVAGTVNAGTVTRASRGGAYRQVNGVNFGQLFEVIRGTSSVITTKTWAEIGVDGGSRFDYSEYRAALIMQCPALDTRQHTAGGASIVLGMCSAVINKYSRTGTPNIDETFAIGSGTANEYFTLFCPRKGAPVDQTVQGQYQTTPRKLLAVVAHQLYLCSVAEAAGTAARSTALQLSIFLPTAAAIGARMVTRALHHAGGGGNANQLAASMAINLIVSGHPTAIRAVFGGSAGLRESAFAGKIVATLSAANKGQMRDAQKLAMVRKVCNVFAGVALNQGMVTMWAACLNTTGATVDITSIETAINGLRGMAQFTQNNGTIIAGGNATRDAAVAAAAANIQ